MKKLYTTKRVLAGVLAMLTVAAYMPANVRGFLTRSTEIVAHADEPMEITNEYVINNDNSTCDKDIIVRKGGTLKIEPWVTFVIGDNCTLTVEEGAFVILNSDSKIIAPQGSITCQGSVLVYDGDRPSERFAAIIASNEIKADKIKARFNTNLGTSGISSPVSDYSHDSWTGSYVRFGHYPFIDNKFEHMIYRVLDPNSNAYGVEGGSLLLDCQYILYASAFGNNELNKIWKDSYVKAGLNGDSFLDKQGVFTNIEKNAIAGSKRGEKVYFWDDVYYYDNGILNGEKVFVLNAEEAYNNIYGYTSDKTRTKLYDRHIFENPYGAYGWWLRSPYSQLTSDNYQDIGGGYEYKAGYVYSTLKDGGSLEGGSITTSMTMDAVSGVSPAFNVKKSDILFNTRLSDGNVYNLTLKDPNMSIAVTDEKSISKSGNIVTVPYTITDTNSDDGSTANSASVMITDGEYTDEDSWLLYYAPLIVKDGFSNTGTRTFVLPNNVDYSADWIHIYLIAESINGESGTDYASEPLEIKLPTHVHTFSYEIGTAKDTLTATCSTDDCGLIDKKISITLAPPESTTYDGTEKEARLNGVNFFNEVTGLSLNENIQYYQKTNNTYSSTAMTTKPKELGDYKAVFKATINGTPYTLEKEFTIGKVNIDMSGVNFENTTLTYTGQPQNLLGKQDATLPTGGTQFKYAVIDISSMPDANNSSTQNIQIPDAPTDEKSWKDTAEATNAGVYMVYCKAIGDATHSDSEPKVVLAQAKINKANPTVTPPTTKNPTYSSSAVQLIDAGTVPEGCTMYYAVSNIKPAFDADGWESDATKITANSAGTYKVWYKVTGSDNYNDVAVNYIPVTVTTSQSTSTPVVSTRSNQRWTISLPSYIYDGTAHEVEIIGDIYGKIIYYYYNADTDELLDGAPSEVGNYRVRVYAGGSSSYNSRNQSVEYAITNPIDKNGMANVGEFKTNNAIPTVKGKIFAGYFTDSTCTTPYTKDSGKAYAKFIDEKILTVKAQISSKTTADSASTSIRFITSVDSLKYQNVGFKITYNGKTIDKQTATVYTVLLANGKKVYPSVFSADSHYMEAYALNNIPNNAFGKEFTVTPYYTTQDGTIVDGKTNTFTIANMIKN